MFFKNQSESQNLLLKLSNAAPSAMATVKGGESYPDICGKVQFYNFDDACVVTCLLHSLPKTSTNFFGFHLHQNGDCSENFSSAGEHYGENAHPNHKGDLPVIFSCDGNAILVTATNRFKVSEIIGRSVIIHESPDDFTSQPSGNSGKRIASGVIQKV